MAHHARSTISNLLNEDAPHHASVAATSSRGVKPSDLHRRFSDAQDELDDLSEQESRPPVKSKGGKKRSRASGGGGKKDVMDMDRLSVKRQRSPRSPTHTEQGDMENWVRPMAITCGPCRARKIKCDSAKPVCKNCQRSPHECYYPIKLKPGLRAGSGSDMARRLERVEERVHQYELLVEQHEHRINALTALAPSGLGPTHASFDLGQQGTDPSGSVFSPLDAFAAPLAPAGHSLPQVNPVLHNSSSGPPSHAHGTGLPDWPGDAWPITDPQETGRRPDSPSMMLHHPETPSYAFTHSAGPAGVGSGVSGGISTFSGPSSSERTGPASMFVGTGFGPGGGVEPSPGGISGPSAMSPMSFFDPNILPPSDIVRDLIDLFWTRIHPWAPILGPSDLPPSLRGRTGPNGQSGNSAKIPESAWRMALRPPWDIVVHAIVVVTLRLSNDPRLEGKKEQYRTAAKQVVISHAIESTSTESLQAIALLTLDLIGSEQGPSSWGILALLTRSAVHLGLSRETAPPSSAAHVGMGRAAAGPVSRSSRPPSATPDRAPLPPAAPSLSRTNIIPPPSDWQDDESRRRLFWLIFILDRVACVSTGWDFALGDFEIQRRLPASDALWAEGPDKWYSAPLFVPIPHQTGSHGTAVGEGLSPFAYLVEAVDLLGRAHTLQAETIDPSDARAVDRRRDASTTLTSAAKRWFTDLPFRHLDAQGQTALSLMVQGIHHATVLKLNAYYAFPALAEGKPIEPYNSTCLESTREMGRLAQIAGEIGYDKTSSPFFIWSCWVAARVLFVHSFLSQKADVPRDFETILSALREQSRYWSSANQYVKLLDRARRKWLKALSQLAAGPRRPPSGGGLDQLAPSADANVPEAIQVLLDLRRTAYNAVGAQGRQIRDPESRDELAPGALDPKREGEDAMDISLGGGVGGNGPGLFTRLNSPTFQAQAQEMNLGHLPAWAVEPVLGDLHSWFDLPAGLFGDGQSL